MITFLLSQAIARTTLALRLRYERADGVPVAGAKATRTLRARGRKVARALLAGFILFHIWYVGATTLIVACFRYVDPAATTLSVYRKYASGWKIVQPVPTDLKRIPLTARRMLVSIEDYKFWEHHGIDLEAFERAVEINKRIGKPMYGGSTLTMQTARTLFLVPFKSYLRKYLEVIVAFELELLLSKERILELYFSWAEWGKGVFGIEAASRLYYGAPVAKLGASQTARLMAVLSSPIRFTPKTLAKSALLQSRYDFLVERYVR